MKEAAEVPEANCDWNEVGRDRDDCEGDAATAAANAKASICEADVEACTKVGRT